MGVVWSENTSRPIVNNLYFVIVKSFKMFKLKPDDNLKFKILKDI